MISGGENGFRRRWKRRRIILGGLGFVLTVLTMVSWGLEAFKEEERYSTVDARETMHSRTANEVDLSRVDFANQDRLVSTVPPPVRDGDHPPQGWLEVAVQSDPEMEGLGKPAGSPRPPEADPVASTAGSGRPSAWIAGEGPPESWAGGRATTSEPSAPGAKEEEPPPYANPHASSPALPDEMFDTVMLIGADASGRLADSIVLALFPEDGSAAALVSIPRDLYLPNPCTKDYRRVNASLWGCRGGVSGPELLAVVVEDFTGVAVDHYVRIEFEGFVEVVDGLGGVEICFEYPTHDLNASLDIPEAGCVSADGATALAYARSRNARQLVDGEWRSAWSSDTVRQRHQREILVELASSLRDASLADLAASFQSLAHAFRLDSGWSVAEAVGWAWRYRDFDLSTVRHLVVPVDDHQTPFGELVTVPTQPFNQTLSRWWEAAGR